MILNFFTNYYLLILPSSWSIQRTDIIKGSFKRSLQGKASWLLRSKVIVWILSSYLISCWSYLGVCMIIIDSRSWAYTLDLLHSTDPWSKLWARLIKDVKFNLRLFVSWTIYLSFGRFKRKSNLDLVLPDITLMRAFILVTSITLSSAGTENICDVRFQSSLWPSHNRGGMRETSLR